MTLLPRAMLPVCSTALVCTVLLAGPPRAHADLVTGLDAYYQFNGNGLDSSGNGHNLNVVGAPGYAPGLSGEAFDLQGNPNQYAIGTSDVPAFNFGSSDFAIQLWVNFNTFGSSVQTLIEKFSGMTGPGWSLTAIDNEIQFYAPNAGVLNSGAVSIQTGAWNQIVVERSGNDLDMYLNGSLLASSPNFSGSILSSTNPLLIGMRNAQDGRNFDVNGPIDEVAIWDRTLSSAEITSLWNDGEGMAISTSVPEPSAIMSAGVALLCGAAIFIARRRNASDVV